MTEQERRTRRQHEINMERVALRASEDLVRAASLMTALGLHGSATEAIDLRDKLGACVLRAKESLR